MSASMHPMSRHIARTAARRRLRRRLRHQLARRLAERAGHHHDRHHDHDHVEESPTMFHHDHHGGPSFGPHHRGGRGRHRARRGAIVDAVLLLLDERPMHGYELITELEARSDGRWRPSAGTMYPALGRMEDRGLLVAEEVDGKKRYSLSDVGRERLDAYLAERDADTPAPWDDPGSGGRGDLRRHVAELVGQVRQVGRFGSTEQIDATVVVLRDTTARLYAILAERPDSATDDNA